MFLINFAEYLGLKYIEIEFENSLGVVERKKLNKKEAIAKLVSNKFHQTRILQSIRVEIPIGKGKKKISIVDTAGLTDDIHPEIEVRKAISQSLCIIRESDVILHIIDASSVYQKDLPSCMGQVDFQVAQFAQLKRGYAILANKIDIPGSEKGVKKIKEEFCGNYIIPISALYKKGFKEVKVFVTNNI